MKSPTALHFWAGELVPGTGPGSWIFEADTQYLRSDLHAELDPVLVAAIRETVDWICVEAFWEGAARETGNLRGAKIYGDNVNVGYAVLDRLLSEAE